jgi:hypothetical protein
MTVPVSITTHGTTGFYLPIPEVLFFYCSIYRKQKNRRVERDPEQMIVQLSFESD